MPSMKVSMSSRTCSPSSARGKERILLLGDDRLRLRARLEVLKPHDEADGGEARARRSRRPRVEARLLDEEAAVLGDEPAGGPDAVLFVVRGDVRDVEAVADDRDVGVGRGLDRARPVGAEIAQRLGLEEVVEVASVTLSKSGVRSSYIFAWSSASGTIGNPPYCPDGMMLSAVSA